MQQSTIHTNNGRCRLATKLPMNHLMPSLLSRERTGNSGAAALMSHDTKNSTTSATARRGNNLYIHIFHFTDSFLIWLQIVNIDDAKFERTHDQSRGINTHPTITFWE